VFFIDKERIAVANPSGFNAALRHKARHYAMQALYQWHMSHNALQQIENQFRAEYDFNQVDLEFFQELLHNVPAQLTAIDALITPHLDRPIKEITPIELALLRMGAYELANRIDVPFKVAINEAVSLAKKFGAAESHKYINGILDNVAKQTRAVEVAAAKR
jgi:N utilization substance protein B